MGDRMANFEMSLVEATTVAGAGALLLSAVRVAVPKTRRFLPIGGTDFNQAAIFLAFAVSGTVLYSVFLN